MRKFATNTELRLYFPVNFVLLILILLVLEIGIYHTPGGEALILKKETHLCKQIYANTCMVFIYEINPLQSGVAFLYPPENIRKPLSFLFSGGIEKQHRTVMG